TCALPICRSALNCLNNNHLRAATGTRLALLDSRNLAAVGGRAAGAAAPRAGPAAGFGPAHPVGTHGPRAARNAFSGAGTEPGGQPGPRGAARRAGAAVGSEACRARPGRVLARGGPAGVRPTPHRA